MEKVIKHKKQFALFTSFFILFTVLFSSFSCFAISGFAPGNTYYLATEFDIDDTFNTASAYDNEFGFDSATTLLQNAFDTALSQNLPYVFSTINNMSIYQDYWNSASGYVCYFSGNEFRVAFPSEGSFIVKDSSDTTYIAYRNYSSLPDHPQYVGYKACSYFTNSNGSTTSTQLFGNVRNVSIDGDNSYGFLPITKYVVNCNLDMRVSDVSLTQGTNFSSSDFSAVSNPNSKFNKDNIINHLTLGNNSKFYISNQSFDRGTFYMYPVFDKTQLEDNESLDAYYVRITGSASYGCTKYSGTRWKIRYNGSSIFNYYPMHVNQLNFFDFSYGVQGNSYLDIPVSNFNNGTYSISLHDINASMRNSQTDNSLEILAGALDETYSGKDYWDATLNAVQSTSITGFKFNLADISTNDFDCVPQSASYHFDVYVVKKSATTNEEDIGDVQCSLDCDFVTGTMNSNNINTTSPEDVMNALGSDNIPSSYVPQENSNTAYGGSLSNTGNSSSANSGDNLGGSGSANIGEGAIVINNNPTFNNGGGTGVSQTDESTIGNSSWAMTKMIQLIAQNKTSSVDEMESITGVNAWLNIIKTTWSFVPEKVWDVLIITFTTSMSIIIVALIIRLVYNFVT